MATFKDIEKMECGARFVNVDLHIHSYGASHDVNDAGMTPSAIVDSAVKQGLSVIAITDHNSDQNVQETITHAHRLGADILVIPGVEVTTAHGHILAYFAPDKVDNLSRFLAKLDLIGPKGADNTHTAKSSADVIKEAYSLDGVCIAAHIDREKTGFERFAPGFQNWKRDILLSPGLFGLECDVVENLDWYSERDRGSSDAATRKAIFEARADIPELRGRAHLAHVQGSDSHTIESFESAGFGKQWTRMKLTELTWNGFRTALIDATARVVPKRTVPKAIPRVRGVTIIGGFLDGEMIHFNNNLNCFIGGRGTGKSTALRALAYAFGLNEGFSEYDNCPDSITVYCEDANGVLYRYERTRGGEINVSAKEGESIFDVPTDAFGIEYLGQGDLAEIAKDPLKSPQLLQSFLDRYINLSDLAESERGHITALAENAVTLGHLEEQFRQFRANKKTYGEIEQKLKVAEESKLKDIVSLQNQVSSERTIKSSVEGAVSDFKRGISLAKWERDFDEICAEAGTVTNESESMNALRAIRDTINATNKFLKEKGAELNKELKVKARELEVQLRKLKASHGRIESNLAPKIADLKAKGLAPNISELQGLLRKKTALGTQMATVEKRQTELKELKDERERLRTELAGFRTEMTARRKAQLKRINANLGTTIRDYNIFLKFDEAGIIDDFLSFVKGKMLGSYMQDQIIRQLCNRISPSDLAEWILEKDVEALKAASGIDAEWADELIAKMRNWSTIFELQAVSKPPKPVITVRTKSNPPTEIPVTQLSDGQRHTILLTVAMLADSNLPLVIDQPEDDLDNAFIASSIVTTLRSVKERRQVIFVTHNANIAVLGDSELILPMERSSDRGQVIERGAIDKETTKHRVQNILEGGPDAFARRQQIYGH